MIGGSADPSALPTSTGGRSPGVASRPVQSSQVTSPAGQEASPESRAARSSVSADGPLAGWRVLIPRPAGRAAELAALLRSRGAEPWHVPLIGIVPMTHSPALRDAVTALAAGGYDWVAFTSAAAVTALTGTADEMGRTLAVDAATRVAAVGAATAHAASEAGLRVDLMPPAPGSGATLAAAWPDAAPGTTVLLPRSDRAAAELPDLLRARGHRVVEVCAYRTETLPIPGDAQAALHAGEVDAVLFTSPSTARALAGTGIASTTRLVAIGQPTADALRDTGLTVHAIAADPSAAGLVAALERAAARTATGPALTAADHHEKAVTDT